MRIAQVVPVGAQRYSGVPAVIGELAFHLALRGHAVEIWLLQSSREACAALGERQRGHEAVRVVDVGGPWWARLGALSRREVDIVHLHSVFSLPNAALAARLRAPYVLSPHGGYARACLTRGARRKALFARVIERPMVRQAALRVALTGPEAADVAAFAGRPAGAIIPNGVAPTSQGIDRLAFRRELGLQPETPLLVFVGRLDVYHKGLDDLIPGVAAAAPWHLALVGADVRNGAAWLRAESEMLGAQRRVHIVGPRSGQALHESFAAADYFVLMSRWEGLPLSLLEALEHGLGSLVSPAVNQVVPVAQAGAGWSIPPCDLGMFLRDLQRPRSLNHAARALAARYDWRTVALQYEFAYARAIGSRGEGSAE